MIKPFVILFLGFTLSTQAQNKSFSFVAFGDMPYFLPDDYVRFERLIEVVNKENQVFNVHVGDIKSSKTPCTDNYYKRILEYFNEFKKQLIYTPGDNEWTDCNSATAGSFSAEERLNTIRKIFFFDDQSLGQEKIHTIVQSKNSAFSKFVENRLWDVNSITFGTLHAVGSNNSFLINDENSNKEFFERDKANLAWLNEIFDHALKIKSKSVFIFMQADMFSPDEKQVSGFENLIEELKKRTLSSAMEVILIHGDSHHFLVDKPLKQEEPEKSVKNFTRIQVFGEYEIHAVKITVNPDTGSFQIEQLIIPEN